MPTKNVLIFLYNDLFLLTVILLYLELAFVIVNKAQSMQMNRVDSPPGNT